MFNCFMCFLRRLFILFAIISFSHFLWAADYSIKDGYTVVEAIAYLEEKHDVVVFYDERWFEGKTISKEILDLPLTEAIYSIIRGENYSVYFFTGNVALFPRESGTDYRPDATADLIIIGNTLEMGRYPRVTITGKVIDGGTGEPIVGAAIYSFKTGNGVATDADGNFEWRLSVGDHRLNITSMGYQQTIYNVLVASEGYVEFQLFEGALELSLYTITAERAEEQIKSTQMSMIRLDAQTLKEIPGAFGERDIIRAFTMLPGIQSVGEFGTGFNVRGGSADQNLILIEDVPLFNSSHLFGLVSVVNPDMVTGVTMMKAGMPARYGERASSVTEIRKSGVQYDETSLKGGLGLLYSRAHLETPLFKDKVMLSLGGRSSYSNWFLQRLPDSQLMNSEANFYDLSGVLSFYPSSNSTISIFGYQSQDDFLQGGETEHHYTSQLASLRWSYALSPVLFSQLTLGYSNYYNRMRERPDVRPKDAFHLDNAIRYQSAKWNLKYDHSNVFSLNTGAQAILYDVSPGQIKPIGEESFIQPKSLDNEKGLEMATYLSGQFAMGDDFGIEAGLRLVHFRNLGPASVFLYDENKIRNRNNIIDTLFYDSGQTVWSDWGVEPRLSFRYLFSDVNSLKLSFNRNHQYISLLSATAVMTPTDMWQLSNPYIKPIVSDQIALGYYHNFNDHTLETSVEGYIRRMRNMPDYISGASLLMNETVETELVSTNGYNLGAELYVNKKEGRLTGWVSYTLSASIRRTDETDPLRQINQNNYFPSDWDRPHNLTINTNYYLSRRWRLNTTFTYSTGRPVTFPELMFNFQGHQAIYYSDRNKYRLADYHRLDVSITFGENLRVNTRGKGSWTFSVINVYGRKNPFSAFYKQDIPHAENMNRRYSLYQLYIIARPLPTITYNFSI